MASNSNNEITRTELLFTVFICKHNFPFASVDHVSMFVGMFPNLPEVKKYACERTKSGCLVKEIESESKKDPIKDFPFFFFFFFFHF